MLRSIADRIAVLDRGELAALGTIDDVFDDPRHPYVMALAGALDAGHAIIDDLESTARRYDGCRGAARRRHRAVAGAPRSTPHPPVRRSCPVRSRSCPTATRPWPRRCRRGGGTVAPLDDATRGIVWTASSGAGELEAVLDAHPGVELGAAAVGRRRRVRRACCGEFAGDGRVWTSAKGAYAQPVAEHALMLALAVLMRELPRRVRAEHWEVDERGRSLYGADVVIVGAGGIAVELLRLLPPFDVRATIVRRRTRPSRVPRARCPAATRRRARRRRGGLRRRGAHRRVHAVSSAVRNSSDARRGAMLVNVARGALVDTDAAASRRSSRADSAARAST